MLRMDVSLGAPNAGGYGRAAGDAACTGAQTGTCSRLVPQRQDAYRTCRFPGGMCNRLVEEHFFEGPSVRSLRVSCYLLKGAEMKGCLRRGWSGNRASGEAGATCLPDPNSFCLRGSKSTPPPGCSKGPRCGVSVCHLSVACVCGVCVYGTWCVMGFMCVCSAWCVRHVHTGCVKYTVCILCVDSPELAWANVEPQAQGQP